MSVNSPTRPDRPVKLATIARMMIGPRADCRQDVWNALVDFHQWASVIPGLRGVRIINGDPVGRGTELHLGWGRRNERWNISHWHPEQRLEMIRPQTNPELGIRIDLVSAQDSEHIQLRWSLEIKCYGIWALFGPVVKFLMIRRLRTRFRPLLNQLHK